MSLYYENGVSTKIDKAYSENKQVWLVYKGDNLVWSFKEDYASMKLSDSTYKTWYFTNGHSIRFYDMRNVGLTPEIKSYKDVTNHKKHCKNVYAKTYNLLANGSYKETGIYSCTGNFVFDYEDVDENLYPACGVIPYGSPLLNIDTNSINYTYYVKNDNSPSGVDRVDTIRDYSFFNGLFKNCINMHGSFKTQKRLMGKAVCGALTKDFADCFKECASISEAVCGPSVINMVSAYKNCSNLTGSAACGPSVVNMEYAYKRCRNLTQAACSDSVVNMLSTYEWCGNLTGYAACGSSVENMHATYYECGNLQYGVCGENVKDFSSAYEECRNLLSCNIGNNVTNMRKSFYQCKNLISTSGRSDLVENMRSCFYECYNLQTFYMSNSATDIGYCYYGCENLQGSVYIPETTVDAEWAFRSCSNISGATIKSSKISRLNTTFKGCKNLKQVTIAASTENITDMSETFAECSNLTSLSVADSSFSNVKKMGSCFINCSNLRMHCIIPPNVEDLGDAYGNCKNVYGSITLPETFTSIYKAFINTGITSITFPNVGSMSWLHRFRFIDRSEDVINRYGTVTIYCPAGAGILESIKEEYNFYKNDNGTIVYTGHNNAQNIDLVLI